MICHANIRLPKKPSSGVTRCYTQEVIDQLVKSINDTTGYHVVDISNSETEDVLKIEINKDIVDVIMFE